MYSSPFKGGLGRGWGARSHRSVERSLPAPHGSLVRQGALYTLREQTGTNFPTLAHRCPQARSASASTPAKRACTVSSHRSISPTSIRTRVPGLSSGREGTRR